IVCFLEKHSCEMVSFPPLGWQSSIIAKVTFFQPARKEALLTGDEQISIARRRTRLDEPGVDEVADFNRSERRLDRRRADAKGKWPIIMTEDRTALCVDLASAVSHPHTNRDAFVFPCK